MPKISFLHKKHKITGKMPKFERGITHSKFILLSTVNYMIYYYRLVGEKEKTAGQVIFHKEPKSNISRP